MGLWSIPADVLARIRFAASPIAEIVGALGSLSRTISGGDPVFTLRHQNAFEAMLEAHPGRRAVFEHYRRPGWLADFMCIPPPSISPTFGEELQQIVRQGDEQLREQLRRSTPAVLPDVLEESGVTEHVRGLLTWTWTHTIATDWPRRERILRADIVTRTHRLAEHGFDGVLKDLGTRREWVDGHLRVNTFDLPTRYLPPTAHLTLVPAHTVNSWVGWDLPHRYAVYYPVAGPLATTGTIERNGLSRLIGGNRARLLAALGTPQTTTSLAAMSGIALGAVGNHLKVLLEAGTVMKRRSGREVLYWRTALGDELVAAAG